MSSWEVITWFYLNPKNLVHRSIHFIFFFGYSKKYIRKSQKRFCWIHFELRTKTNVLISEFKQSRRIVINSRKSAVKKDFFARWKTLDYVSMEYVHLRHRYWRVSEIKYRWHFLSNFLCKATKAVSRPEIFVSGNLQPLTRFFARS